ncbi:hypothetical protein B4092_0833 [Bacillus licheniformis]|nr:hypothetical protein B4092_0833 [Bacillus licheniformis]
MEFISHIVDTMNGFLWGPPLLILIVGTGIYLTFRLAFLQVRLLPYSLKLAFSRHQDKSSEGDISHFQALMTALALRSAQGISSASPQLLLPAGRAPYFGCGSPPSSEWRRNMLKRCLLSDSA